MLKNRAQIEAPNEKPWLSYGFSGFLLILLGGFIFMIAAINKSGWSETFAFGCVIVAGAWIWFCSYRAVQQEERRDVLYRDYLAAQDQAILQMAYDSPEFDSQTRGAITAFLNKTAPGWSLILR